VIKTKNGLDLPISGTPSAEIDKTTSINSVAVLGSDYSGLKPTMLVKEGDTVNLGQKLFEDKKNPGTFITAPASGSVQSINRGEKRRFLSLVINVDDSVEPLEFDASNYNSPQELLIDSGAFSYFRTRPYNRIPEANSTPDAIFVNACDSNPLAIDPIHVIEQNQELFNDGLSFLHLSYSKSKIFCNYQNTSFDASIAGVIYTQFSGPHPSGLTGTHIHFLYPVGQNRSVWTISYQDLISLGHLIKNKKLRTTKTISLAGPSVLEPKLLEVRYGSNLSELTAGKIELNSRVISGSVLNGHAAEGVMDYLGAYDHQVSVLPDEANDILFNWAMPGIKLHSQLSIFISSWLKPKEFIFNTSMNGGDRAIVPVSSYQAIMPLNILTTQLLKSLVTMDIELGEKLGALELAPEDLALASYVCPSKYDYQSILNLNLEKMYEEFK